MKKLNTLMVLGLAVCLAGCLDIVTVNAKADQVKAAAPQVEQVVTESLAAADPVLDEAAKCGLTLSNTTLGKGETVANKTKSVMQGVSQAAGAVALIPGPQQPIAGAVAAVAGAVAGIAGAFSAFFARRRKNQLEKALDTALQAGVSADNFGKTITAAASINGTAAVINERYVASGAAAVNETL